MVHLYRAGIYLIIIVAALLFYLLLRRLFSHRTRVVPMVAAILAATGLIWAAHFMLSQPRLLVKYAPFLKVGDQGVRMNMVSTEFEVRICDRDGSGDELFLPKDYPTTRDISWSPDGSRIICSRVRDSAEGMQLFIYDANGENPVQVTTGRGVCRRPSWSPDGDRIVFDFRPTLRQKTTDICTINADGSNRSTLTTGDRVNAYHPVWSPDGRSIYCCVKQKNRRGDIWVMDVDGANLRQLTFTPDHAETEPAVSPDGSTLVLSINYREIYLVDADGSRLRPLIAEGGHACRGRDPSWSPDGQRILFAGFGTTKSRRSIKEIGADGDGLRQIAVQDEKLRTPILHPDGTRMAYLLVTQKVFKKVSPSKRLAGGISASDSGKD